MYKSPFVKALLWPRQWANIKIMPYFYKEYYVFLKVLTTWHILFLPPCQAYATLRTSKINTGTVTTKFYNTVRRNKSKTKKGFLDLDK